jgi:hypothetical protein
VECSNDHTVVLEARAGQAGDQVTVSLTEDQIEDILSAARLWEGAGGCAEPVDDPENPHNPPRCWILSHYLYAREEVGAKIVLFVGPLQACFDPAAVIPSWIKLPGSHHGSGIGGGDVTTIVQRRFKTDYIFEPGYSSPQPFNPYGPLGKYSTNPTYNGSGTSTPQPVPLGAYSGLNIDQDVLNPAVNFYPKGTIVQVGNGYFVAATDLAPTVGPGGTLTPIQLPGAAPTAHDTPDTDTDAEVTDVSVTIDNQGDGGGGEG